MSAESALSMVPEQLASLEPHSLTQCSPISTVPPNHMGPGNHVKCGLWISEPKWGMQVCVSYTRMSPLEMSVVLGQEPRFEKKYSDVVLNRGIVSG